MSTYLSRTYHSREKSEIPSLVSDSPGDDCICYTNLAGKLGYSCRRDRESNGALIPERCGN